MDRGGHAGCGGGDHAVMNRLMLKFRPIAPKPINEETPTAGLEANDLTAGKVKLPKRKYVRSRKNNIKRSPSRKRTGKLLRQENKDGSVEEEKEKEEEEESTNMLRLLPEKAGEEHKVDTGMLSLPSTTVHVSGQEKPSLLINSINDIFRAPERYSDMQLSMDSHGAMSFLEPFSFHNSNRGTTEQSSHFGLYFPDRQPYYESSSITNLNYQFLFQLPRDQPAMMQDSGVLGSRVVAVVETVTMDCHASADPQELGGTDSEIIKNLGLDASPGFVSDSSSMIRWVNGAFRKMVTAMGGHQCWPPLLPVESVTMLVMKDVLPGWCRAVSGQVRVKLQQDYHRGTVLENLSDQKGYCKWQQVMPCDAWRMDCGGFAWRLDLKAALTLGR